MKVLFKYIIINLVLVLSILSNICVFDFGGYNFNKVTDNAILANFFSISNTVIDDVSFDVIEYKDISSQEQTGKTKTQKSISDFIFINSSSFIVVSEMFSNVLLGIAVVLCGFFIFKCNFDFSIWRCIVFLLIFKMLFAVLPRSISIKTILLNIYACALFNKAQAFLFGEKYVV